MEVSSDLHDSREIFFHEEIKSPIRLLVFSSSQLSTGRDTSVGVGGDGSSVFVWGLAHPGSDLYGVPLRIYGEKPPRRSHPTFQRDIL